MLSTHLRSRKQAPGSGQAAEQLITAHWDPFHTGIILCDIWDHHWCSGAERRVDELAHAVAPFVERARDMGVFIIHAPSDTMGFYAGTPARQRALRAPLAAMPQRRDLHEPPLPIDDSDGGCDSGQTYERPVWTRQHAAIRIDGRDAVTDDGQQVYNLVRQRGIEHIALLGVHTNMCVVGRSFGLRALASIGLDAALVRDLTDAMYNPAKPPHVSHLDGTRLVVEHIETFICPSFENSDWMGGKPFRFRGEE